MTYGVFKSVMHASYLSLEGKNDEKNSSQISKSQYIEIKSAWKKHDEILHNTSRFLEMELWRLKVHV